MTMPFFQCRKASSAVEFALLAPVYLLFLFGLIAYGILITANHSVQQLAAEAARISVAGLNEAERRSLARAFIAAHADGYAFIDPARLEVEVADSADDANRFVVAITYDASNLPVWNLLDGLPLPGAVIDRSSTVRLGGI